MLFDGLKKRKRPLEYSYSNLVTATSNVPDLRRYSMLASPFHRTGRNPLYNLVTEKQESDDDRQYTDD